MFSIYSEWNVYNTLKKLIFWFFQMDVILNKLRFKIILKGVEMSQVENNYLLILNY